MNGGDWLRRMLLPVAIDGVFGDDELPSLLFQLPWIDRQVDYEQKVCYFLKIN